MARGNLFLGTARGSLGDITMYRYDGQQVSRVRLKKIKNPQSNAQCVQRCVISTAVRFYSLFAEVLNHAYQNYSGPLRNNRRYMKMNCDIMRRLALDNIYTWSPLSFYPENLGNWVGRNETEIPLNPYLISEGDIEPIGTTFIGAPGNQYPTIGNPSTTDFIGMSYKQVCEHLGLQLGDQLTFLFTRCKQDTGYIEYSYYARIIMMPSSGNPEDKFLINNGTLNKPNKENYGSIEVYSTEVEEGKFGISIGTASNILTRNTIDGFGCIVSRYENNMWKRSTSYMRVRNGWQANSSLKDAVETFRKEETSSLYLNQANDIANDTTLLQARNSEDEENSQGTKRKAKRE